MPLIQEHVVRKVNSYGKMNVIPKKITPKKNKNNKKPLLIAYALLRTLTYFKSIALVNHRNSRYRMRTPTFLSEKFVATKWPIYKDILTGSRFLRERISRGTSQGVRFVFVNQSLLKRHKLDTWKKRFRKRFESRKADFMGLFTWKMTQRNGRVR